MTEENLTHEDGFGHLADDRIMSSIECHWYLDNQGLFLKFLEYKLQGKLMKQFPKTTLGELRKWKKENT